MERCGLSDLQSEFEARQWTSFRRFAFANSFSPAQASDAAFMSGVVDVLKVAHDSPKVGGLRSFNFESYTTAAHSLRARLERTDDDPPVRLPNAEREPRRRKLVDRLVGPRPGKAVFAWMFRLFFYRLAQYCQTLSLAPWSMSLA